RAEASGRLLRAQPVPGLSVDGRRDLFRLPADAVPVSLARETDMSDKTDDLTAVDRVSRAATRRKLIVLGLIAIIPLIALSFILQISRINRPVDQATDEMYFRYGSIGSDVEGVPYWVFRVLPDICPAE